jgi:hypothetical protein
MISFAFCVPLVRTLKKPPALCAGKPVPEPSAEFLHFFHPPDACCEIGTEQAIVGSLVGQSAHSRAYREWGKNSAPFAEVII